MKFKMKNYQEKVNKTKSFFYENINKIDTSIYDNLKKMKGHK